MITASNLARCLEELRHLALKANDWHALRIIAKAQHPGRMCWIPSVDEQRAIDLCTTIILARGMDRTFPCEFCYDPAGTTGDAYLAVWWQPAQRDVRCCRECYRGKTSAGHPRSFVLPPKDVTL